NASIVYNRSSLFQNQAILRLIFLKYRCRFFKFPHGIYQLAMYPDFGGYFSVASCVFVYTKTTCQTQFGKQKSQLILLMDMKKTKNIILRCTEDEKKKIQDFAKEYGLNVTQYIIKKSLNQPVNINHKEVVRTIHLLNV